MASGLAAPFSSYVGGLPYVQLGEHPRKDPELTGKILYIMWPGKALGSNMRK